MSDSFIQLVSNMPTCGKHTHTESLHEWPERPDDWVKTLGEEAESTATTEWHHRKGGKRWDAGQSVWGGKGHAVSLAFTVQAGGSKESHPSPCIHRWALCSAIMRPIVPSCPSALYHRDRHKRKCTFEMRVFHLSLSSIKHGCLCSITTSHWMDEAKHHH